MRSRDALDTNFLIKESVIYQVFLFLILPLEFRNQKSVFKLGISLVIRFMYKVRLTHATNFPSSFIDFKSFLAVFSNP